jgi:uncharacterized heparinase superfamily protein
LIGDSDSGQVLPIVRRNADDHRYLVALGAAVFHERAFKDGDSFPEELLWVLGESGVRDFAALPVGAQPRSQEFPDAGTYVLRDNDLYLLFNASGSGLRGRGSHGHNDALGVEISACGTAFVVDPGSYVYSADLHERHLFRSTAYHSTVEIDGVEQNTIDEETPFVIGDEAHPRVIEWQAGEETDAVVAEHDGYRRLTEPVTHRRAVNFGKLDRRWLIEDSFTGEGEHEFSFRFHFAPGLITTVRPNGIVEVLDKDNGARLLISMRGLNTEPKLESRFSSRDYGNKQPSQCVCWKLRAKAPLSARFFLVPVAASEEENERIVSEARA